MHRHALQRLRVAACVRPAEAVLRPLVLRTFASSTPPLSPGSPSRKPSSPRAHRPGSPATKHKRKTLSASIGHAAGVLTRSAKTKASRGANASNQLQALLARSEKRNFVADLEFLRDASNALQTCRTQEHMIAALPLCHVVARASIVHGTAAIGCVRIYQRLGRNHEALALVDKLLTKDFMLTNPVLSHALHACASLKDVAKGAQLYETALARGTIPNLAVYGALLALHASAGDMVQVDKVRETMEAAGMHMNTSSYQALIGAYAKGGHVQEADEAFAEMKDAGLESSDRSYALLMDGYAESGDYDRTIALLDELKASLSGNDDTPNLVHYNVALKACGKAHQLAKAFELYEEMKSRKVRPDLVTYLTMMHAVFHGELAQIDTKKVKWALAGVGCMGAAFVPFIDLEKYLMTTLFCGSMVGSMGLAAYMNPDGVLRALYPNSDEPHNDTVIEAFFRRLHEEDHCGRSMYLWREMLKYNIPADPRVCDVLVRTCVRKRHPELAYEAIFEQKVPLVNGQGVFVLPLPTTVQFLHSLLVQGRRNMADTLYSAARLHGLFSSVFAETNKTKYVYDLKAFTSSQVRSYTILKVLKELRERNKDMPNLPASSLPEIDFLVLHGYELLDQLDSDDVAARALFSMDDMQRESAGPNLPGQYFFRLTAPSVRLAEYFAKPEVTTTAL